MVYIQGNSVPSGNIGVLDKLIAARHEIAQVNQVHIRCLTIFVINYVLIQDVFESFMEWFDIIYIR